MLASIAIVLASFENNWLVYFNKQNEPIFVGNVPVNHVISNGAAVLKSTQPYLSNATHGFDTTNNTCACTVQYNVGCPKDILEFALGQMKRNGTPFSIDGNQDT